MSAATRDADVLPSTESVESLRSHVDVGTIAGDVGAAKKIHASIRCVATLQADPSALDDVDRTELRQTLYRHVNDAGAGERVQVCEDGVLLLVHSGVTERLTDGATSLLLTALIDALLAGHGGGQCGE